ncbi:MAG TPA: hypothetical protein VM734_29700 [Kofleriaceae bacterium]|nr:hypothetical protein [Kofleriaceae bacterium]
MKFASLSLLVVLAAACGPKSTAPAPVSNTSAEPSEAGPAPGVTDGALWTCVISDYDPQPCKFSREGEQWTLRKLLGSQRFAGTATFPPDGSIDFDGKYFCPWGACDTPMQVSFRREAEGVYTTQLGGDQIRLEWNPANAAEYGGAGYGGLTGEEQ